MGEEQLVGLLICDHALIGAFHFRHKSDVDVGCGTHLEALRNYLFLEEGVVRCPVLETGVVRVGVRGRQVHFFLF